MPKNSNFRGCFDKQHVKRGQTLLKYASQHLYHINRSRRRKLSWKKSPSLKCKIFGLLVNTLTANEKYPVLNRDNLTIPTQMQLSEKQKIFSEFLAAFLKSRISFGHFEKKDYPHSFCIYESTDSGNVVR